MVTIDMVKLIKWWHRKMIYNKEDKIMMMIEEKEISHMRMGGRKSEAQKA